MPGGVMETHTDTPEVPETDQAAGQSDPPATAATQLGVPPPFVVPPAPARESVVWTTTVVGFGRWARKHWLGALFVVTLSLLVVAAGAYFSWWVGLPLVLSWANAQPWLWALAWMPVMLLAFTPFYVAFGWGAVVAALLGLLE